MPHMPGAGFLLQQIEQLLTSPSRRTTFLVGGCDVAQWRQTKTNAGQNEYGCKKAIANVA